MKNSLCFSLIYVGVLAALFAVYFTARVFENEMSEQQKRDLRETASLIKNFYGQIPSENFRKNLDSIASKRLRVTLVDRDGMVLYESDAKAGKMENHRSRPEIMDANSKGIGENLFYFAERLSDGKILRLSRRQAILHESVSKTMPYLLALLTGIVVVAVLIAFGLSRAFVRPVQKLAENLGQPELMDDEGIYKEIAPLVKTIRKQNRELQLTIEQLSEEKKKTAKMRDEFTANASHELANDIMTLSKLDSSGESAIGLDESVNLWTLASNCIDELSFNAEKKGVRVALEGCKTAEVYGNRRLLFEMLYNLVDNSIRYTETGGSVSILGATKIYCCEGYRDWHSRRKPATHF